MLQYVMRRLLLAVPMLLGAMSIVFFAMRVLPGDPCIALMGDQATRDALKEHAARSAERCERVQVWLKSAKAKELLRKAPELKKSVCQRRGCGESPAERAGESDRGAGESARRSGGADFWVL